MAVVVAAGAEGTSVTVEAEGWGPLLGAVGGPDPGEGTGWFAGQVVAPLVDAVSPRGIAEWLTDRRARRPQGAAAREGYRHPEGHVPAWHAVLDRLAVGPEDHLLEIGCGGGGLLSLALASGCRAVGVDHSEDMLRLAAGQNAGAIEDGRLKLVRAEADRLPLADGAFTCAAMAIVFMFFADPVAVLREVRRVLRPGGRLAIATIPPELRGTPVAPEPVASHTHLYRDDELAELARRAGFLEVEVARTERGDQVLAGRA